tara:strand:- start:301 stop:495 length:195 start_codon:yes stop_codon:yes gene_type:complete
MSYNYEYLSDEKKISYLIKQIEVKEERLFELEIADQEDVGIIADTEVVTSELANLKAKLAELEG